MTKPKLGDRPNAVLRTLSDEDYGIIAPYLKDTSLKFRQKLQSENRNVQEVFFVESGIASVVAIGGHRQQAEVAIVGNEGLVGLPVVLGVDRSPCEIFMQVEGEGKCISADDLDSAIAESRPILRHLLRYVHAFGVQSAYTALANAHGKLEERLCRWLLMAHDRHANGEMLLTHEFLALMLGVRRAGVTVALQQLEDKGLIGTARGMVSVIDRAGLEEGASGLYGQPEAEFERLFH